MRTTRGPLRVGVSVAAAVALVAGGASLALPASAEEIETTAPAAEQIANSESTTQVIEEAQPSETPIVVSPAEPNLFAAEEEIPSTESGDVVTNKVALVADPVDTAKPIISIPVVGKYINDDYTFNITQVEDNPSTAYVELDKLVNGKWVKLEGVTFYDTNSYAFNPNLLGQDQSAEYQVKVTSKDDAGNSTSAVTPKFSIDLTAPTGYDKLTYKSVNGFAKKYDWKLLDNKCVDGVFVNSVWFDKSNNPYSDHNNIAPGAFGGVEGKNTIQVKDCAGNLSDADPNTPGAQPYISWLDVSGPTFTVKDGFVGSKDDMVFRTVSLGLYDQANVVKATITNANGTFVKLLTPNKWSDLNGLTPGVFGIIEGDNWITLEDGLGSVSAPKLVTIDTTKSTIITPAPVVASGVHVYEISQVEANPAKTYVEFMEKVNGKWAKKFGTWFYNTNTFPFSVDTTKYADGDQYQIKISTWDKATNHTSTTLPVSIDNTPEVVVTPPTDSTPVDEETVITPVANNGVVALKDAKQTTAVVPLAHAGADAELPASAAFVLLGLGVLLLLLKPRRKASSFTS